MKSKNTQHDGHSLLLQLLDLKMHMPKDTEWSIENLPPGTGNNIRLRQVNSIAKGLDLDFDIKSFFSGFFIFQLSDEEAIARLEAMEYAYKDQLYAGLDEHTIARFKKVSPDDALFGIFMPLIRYRIKVQKVYGAFSGVMEASMAHIVGYNLTKPATKALRKECHFIDQLLGVIIHPYANSVTLEKLIEDFDYPDENPESVDMDNW